MKDGRTEWEYFQSLGIVEQAICEVAYAEKGSYQVQAVEGK
jgi:hypothetical protein